jgi:photosystem II stability/assembly factor-like uncharacterized protein
MKRLVLVGTAILLAVFASAAVGWAGNDEWTSLGPDGGPIQALSIDPHNTNALYATTSVRGVFKTTDGGANWGKSDAPNGVLVFDPQDPSTQYAVSGYPLRANDYGILKSTDGGASWSAANAGLPTSDGFHFIVAALAIDPQTPLTLYAGTPYGIYKSMDGAASWSAANSGLPRYATPPGDTFPLDQNRYAGAFQLVINPRNPEAIYAVVDHFNAPGRLVFKSSDGAASWNLSSLLNLA